MVVKIDANVQDANVLLGVTRKYATELAAAGISAEYVQEFENQIAELRTRDTRQKEADNTLGALTRKQNEVLENLQNAIRKIQSAAKTVYDEDKAARAEFLIGKRIADSVSTGLSQLEYIKSVATRRMSDLAACGLQEADVTILDTISGQLLAADQEQENAKQLKTVATAERNAAAAKLKRIKAHIRKSAGFCFMDKPEILAEFAKV